MPKIVEFRTFINKLKANKGCILGNWRFSSCICISLYPSHCLGTPSTLSCPLLVSYSRWHRL